MYENKFQSWCKWVNRNQFKNIQYPGVYIIANSNQDISNQKFEWISNIVYIGMTNAVNGLKGRLNQFDHTISGKRITHGGADRVRFKHQNYKVFCRKAYVTVAPFLCNVESNSPYDLKTMGQVLKFEYDCFAQYAVNFGELPQFNNKKEAPKYSRSNMD